MSNANKPVANPVCSIIQKGNWYEWVLPNRTCEYGYDTWREAHQAAKVELSEIRYNHLYGKVVGAKHYLNALAMALGMGTTIAKKLKRVIKLLEE